MDIQRSTEILETLANGTDPVTGEIMPADSPYNHPDIIRALFACVQHLRQAPKRAGKRSAEDRQADNRQRGLPKNAGMPWSDEARAELAERFGAGESPAQLAKTFERTRNAILSELKRQGLIVEEPAQEGVPSGTAGASDEGPGKP